MGDAAIYRRLVVACVRSELQYRTSFAARVLAESVITFLDCVVILAIFTRVPALGGWDRGQVLVLYATSILSFGMADLIAGPVEQTAVYVRLGTYDRLLIRPVGVLWQIFGYEFGLRRIGRILQSGIVLAVTIATGTVDLPSTPRALFLVPTVIGGAITFGGLFVLVNTLSFWIPNSKEVGNAFTYGGETVAHYPTHIFRPWLRNVALFVVRSVLSPTCRAFSCSTGPTRSGYRCGCSSSARWCSFQ